MSWKWRHNFLKFDRNVRIINFKRWNTSSGFSQVFDFTYLNCFRMFSSTVCIIDLDLTFGKEIQVKLIFRSLLKWAVFLEGNCGCTNYLEPKKLLNQIELVKIKHVTSCPTKWSSYVCPTKINWWSSESYNSIVSPLLPWQCCTMLILTNRWKSVTIDVNLSDGLKPSCHK